MFHYSKYILPLLLLIGCKNKQQEKTATEYNEPHRLQVHFSPKEKWMNDPNGLVYYDHLYHLFYQYYPDSTVWGPMHWGHATSSDLLHWTHQPIALYPDSLGYIFSGSVVVDVNNTSGFGKYGKPALVAIFTQHDPKGEKAGTLNFQNQSIAYSIDEGKTWIKYSGNPVLKNPGIKDFRDPKVRWHEESKKWIMTLATQDRISFYSSPNLKNWTRESDFGKDVGAHGGVWECPDLFPMMVNNEKLWVLLVSINPGGPNGGSATQYFIGSFNGHRFIPFQTDTRWIDYGPDDYAGVTWSNTGERKIFLGWMSNWLYGTKVPTEKWRSAMTVPRDLSLEKIGDKYFLRSIPVPELHQLEEDPVEKKNIDASALELGTPTGNSSDATRLDISSTQLVDFNITLSNPSGEKLVVGYNADSNRYFIDRRKSGLVDFEKDFAAIHSAPRLSASKEFILTVIIDHSSVEVFADNGLTVMTEIFFPHQDYDHIAFQSKQHFPIGSFHLARLKSIWK
ncbi:MAG: glycoside hydrolase family 32 protein [Flavisolibacter sp.]